MTPVDDGAAAAPPRRLHGRRRTKRLRAGRQALLHDLLPRLAVPLDGRAPGSLVPSALFDPAPAAVWIEVGFGAGEHLAWQAGRHPDIGFIGCEPYVAGVSRLLAHVEEQRLANVRLAADDARLLLHALPDASIGRAFVLFPDPWPKARHAERRFLDAWACAELARVLQDGAELRFASDAMAYVRQALALLTGHRDFAWLAAGPQDWRERPADWPPTRYEAKALAAGRPPAYLRFRRRPRGGQAGT